VPAETQDSANRRASGQWHGTNQDSCPGIGFLPVRLQTEQLEVAMHAGLGYSRFCGNRTHTPVGRAPSVGLTLPYSRIDTKKDLGLLLLPQVMPFPQPFKPRVAIWI
jgi:hypothetical protein